jgi:hypothetical protein
VVVAGVAGFSFLVAAIAVLIGSFLLGAGLIVYGGGVDALAWSDPATGRPFRASPGTRAKAIAGGVLSIVYGMQGIIAGLLLVFPLSATLRLDLPNIQGLQLFLLNWMIAAILLIAAASLMASFLSSLRREVASTEDVGALGFVAYAIVNGIAVFIIAGSLLLLGCCPTSGVFDPVTIVGVGAFVEFLVAPTIGVVVFAPLIPTGRRLRRLQSGELQVGSPRYLTVPPYPASGYGLVTPLPSTGPYAAFSTGASVAPADETMDPDTPPPPPEDLVPEPIGGAVWVLQMESEIRELESALEEQRRLLLAAEEGWKVGRIDAATYENESRDGRARVVEVERRIWERRSQLEAGRDDVLNPP